MALARTYGAAPIVLGTFDVQHGEMMFCQYMPVKLAGSTDIKRPESLKAFDALVGAACCEFVANDGLKRFVDSYVYVTAKHLFQGPGTTFNRPGWHCDGFMTDDINYIWCDRTPTIFNLSAFKLTQDDELSMLEMEQQAKPAFNASAPTNALLRLDQFCVHRADTPSQVELRTFLKVSISRDKYDLIGNAHNHLLDYAWPMRPRQPSRNIPQLLATISP